MKVFVTGAGGLYRFYVTLRFRAVKVMDNANDYYDPAPKQARLIQC